mgnify:CR=1 FL=1
MKKKLFVVLGIVFMTMTSGFAGNAPAHYTMQLSCGKWVMFSASNTVEAAYMFRVLEEALCN